MLPSQTKLVEPLQCRRERIERLHEVSKLAVEGLVALRGLPHPEALGPTARLIQRAPAGAPGLLHRCSAPPGHGRRGVAKALFEAGKRLGQRDPSASAPGGRGRQALLGRLHFSHCLPKAHKGVMQIAVDVRSRLPSAEHD